MKKQFLLFLLFIVIFFPFNVPAQWILTNTGLTNTEVHAFAISGTNLFAGASGGVFLSTNNGTSWNAVKTGLTSTYVQALSVSGTNLFAGTDGGVFLSTNNGTNWNAVNNGLSYTSVSALTVSGTNLFAGTNGGVFLSTNNGTNWNAVNNGLSYTFLSALAVSGTNLFAGSGSGVFLSTNNGTSWNAVNNGLPNSYIKALAFSGSNLFAGTFNRGVFLSTNNGTSWNAASTGLTSGGVDVFAVSGTNLFAGSGGGVSLSTDNGTSWTEVNTGFPMFTGVYSLAVSGTNLFAGTYNGVWQRPLLEMTNPAPLAPMLTSPSDGTTGVPINPSLAWNVSIGADSYQLQVSTNSNFSTTVVNQSGVTSTYYAISGLTNNVSYYWRVNASNNGRTSSWSTTWSFTTVDASIRDSSIRCLAINSSGDIFAGTDGSGSIYRSVDNGNSWVKTSFISNGGPVRSLAISPSGCIFTGNFNGDVYCSTDNGNSWTLTSPINRGGVLSLAISSSGTIFAGTEYGGGVVHSTDNGTNWKETGGINDDHVMSLAINSSGYIFAGTVNDGAGAGGCVYRSTDNGNSWIYTTGEKGGFPSLAIDVYGNIFAGTKFGADNRGIIFNQGTIYRSNNSGTSWIATGLEIGDVLSLATNSSGKVFVGTVNGGVYASFGNNWGHSGLTYGVIYSLLVNSSDYIFAGTGEGVYRSIDDGNNWTQVNSVVTGIEVKKNNLPEGFSLNQNYPNPFNPTTAISYSVSKASFVTIKVYDVLGKEVAILVNEEKAVGSYKIVFYAGNLPSGVYFYRMQTGGFVETKKLILLK